MHRSHGDARMVSDGFEVENMGDHPGEPEHHHRHGGYPHGRDMPHGSNEHNGSRHKEGHAAGGRTRLAKGGGADRPGGGRRVKANLYNAQGSPEGEEAKNMTPMFKKGGHHGRRGHHKEGGHADGDMAVGRADRVRRAAGGGTPYSTGHNLTSPSDAKNSRGYEGDGAA